MQKEFLSAACACISMAVALSFALGCGQNEPQESAEAARPSSVQGEWIALFDGSNFDAWQMERPDGWKIENDSMVLAGSGSIWTKERFGNFILDVEFKISPECNSGIFFRTGNLKDPVQTGIEMQVLDSAVKANPDKHDSGALYDLLEPSFNAMKPAGEWNRAIIDCRDNLISIELNGIQIIDADVNHWPEPRRNPDGSENKFHTALKDFPREGHIGFQDHGNPVWYRNARLKRL